MRSLILAVLIGSLVAGSPADAELSSPTPLQNVLDAARSALGADRAESIGGWHYHASVTAVGLSGTADTWIDRSGGAEATYAHMPPVSQDTGYDGNAAWTRDAKGVVLVDGSVAGRATAINALYRDTYALWTANRGGAGVDFVGRRSEANAEYDVVRVTPAGSPVPFEYWFNAVTHLPSRVVETIGPLTTTTTLANYEPASLGLRIAALQKSTDSQGNSRELNVTYARSG